MLRGGRDERVPPREKIGGARLSCPINHTMDHPMLRGGRDERVPPRSGPHKQVPPRDVCLAKKKFESEYVLTRGFGGYNWTIGGVNKITDMVFIKRGFGHGGAE
jgi:hypothetical protein